jgi:hypothetical protein
MNDATPAPAVDPLGALSPRERLRWARHVVRHRAAILGGLAVSGPWMVRRAESILGATTP